MKRVLKRLLLVCFLLAAAAPVLTAPGIRAEAKETSSKKTELEAPSNLRLTKYLNKGLSFKWNKVSKATGYEIYYKNNASKKYKKVGTTKKCSYEITGLKHDNKYDIRVRAYRKEKDGTITYSKFSKISHRAYKIASSMLTVHGRYVQATVRYTTKATLIETGKKITLKAGTKVSSAKTDGTYNTIVLSNGKKAKILRASLTFGNLATTTAYYTKGQKQLFVNSKGYSSPTDYLIWINQYTLNVTIFKGSKGNWKQVRSMPCVVGRNGRTSTGVYKIYAKLTGMYGSYAMYFTGTVGYGNAFHARIDSNWRAAASLGCVRLAVSDLTYMYKNCPIGTTVVSY